MMFEFLSSNERDSALNYLVERFGFSKAVFDNYDFYRTKAEIRICAKGCKEYLQKILNVCDLGYAALRYGKVTKPTTTFIQQFGKYATKNIVQLDESQAKAFISGKDLCLEKEVEKSKASDGYVIVKYRSDCLGLGILRGKLLLNQIPKRKRLNLIEEFKQKD
ncbi:MAG: hypothetical protein ACP5JY_01265 [Candidatus Nanoarchaeia archaeon]